MLTHRHLRLTAATAAIGLLPLLTGCQGVRGAQRGANVPQATAPPLSVIPGSVIPAANAFQAAAPSQLADVNNPVPDHGARPPVPVLPPPPITTANLQGAIPAPQTIPANPNLSPAADSSSSWSASSSPHGTSPSSTATQQAVTPQAVTPQAVTPQMVTPSAHQAACLPDEADWRKQMEQQTAALAERLVEVEGELTKAQRELQSVNQKLEASQGKIDQLNRDVAHWKGEVRRLETEMRTQQLSDLKALDDLTASMHQVLLRQRGAAPQMGAAK